ncbi:MAG TPA: xanthine dehydrogenase family protein molybdopterin-binding subunit [Syntrophorhabdales bacterium]|nr:xanthine dehydrogenase family protein molybdopterin-binding subunit [Syntrophorhabdales bacterium]
MEETLIGKSLPRIDAAEKVTGLAEYTDDLDLSGMLEAELLTSPHAYARILSIDTSKAASLDGVVAIVTGGNIEKLYGTTVKDRPVLARGVVRFVGEPVVAVAATTKEIAREAVRLVDVEYEPLKPVFTPEEAVAPDAPLLHPDLMEYEKEVTANAIPGSNICNHFKIRKGDVARGFAESDYLFEDTYEVPRNHHACIENHSVIAQFEKDGTLHLWTSNQSPYVLQRSLAELFDKPWNKVRVTIPNLGGGFGSKIYPSIEPPIVALAERSGHRPVRLTMDREQDFCRITNHGCTVRIKTGLRKDGTIVARQIVTHWDTGAYADCGPLLTRNSGFTSAGPYRIEHVKIDAYSVYTNRPVATAFRGYGIPHVTWAYENHLNRIAHEMGIDPLEIRLKNVIRDGDLSHTGEKMVAVGMKECLVQVAKAAHWEPGARPARVKLGDGRFRSLGIACSWKGTMRHYATAATVRILEEGSVEVNCSNVDMGQGSATIYSQIAAHELGVPVERVEVRHPDTFITPYDRTTSASRGTFHGGTAVMKAARDAWQQIATYAAKVFRCDPQDVKANNGFIVDPETGHTYSFGEIINKAVPGGIDVIGHGDSYMEGGTGLDRETGQGSNPTSFWMYAAQIAEVEVDTRTGRIKVNKIFAVSDVGRAINRLNCVEQIRGGVTMGLGIALSEELKFDNAGRILNSNLHDYKIPTCPDAPPIDAIIVEVPHPLGPYGAKGLGEAPVGPVAPAVAAALADAAGVWVTKLPMTPERVLDALRKGGR